MLQQYQIRSVEQLDALLNQTTDMGGNGVFNESLLAPELRTLLQMYNEGTAHLQQDRPLQAIPWFQRALQFAPGFVAARCNLGWALAMTGNLERALFELETALDYAADDPDVWLNIAKINHSLGKTVEAEEAYWRVLDARPRDCQTILWLSTILMQAYRLNEAENLLQTAMDVIDGNLQFGPRLSPGYDPHIWDEELFEAQYYLGQIDIANQKWSDAVVHLEKCARIDPRHPDVQELLAEAKRKSRRWFR